MPQLEWDKVGDRVYETGVDRGVLYLPDGSAVAWNGLTSIIEKFDATSSPVYYDGMKINDFVSLGTFSASLRALTYPEEFSEIEGMGSVRSGMFFGDQRPKLFGLCYRTGVGNDLDGSPQDYKIHLLYNVLAIPSDRTHETLGEEVSPTEFEWDISAIPEEVPGFHPTAHIVIDSKNFDPWLLEDLEAMIYGSDFSLASLIPMPELMAYIRDWYRFKVVDNGDGTWTVTSMRPEAIQFDSIDSDMFTLLGINARFLDEHTYEITDTYDVSDTAEIKFVDNGDGTWTATTTHPSLFSVDEDYRFEIQSTNAIFVAPNTYRVSNTSIK
jgi:hypothetical protein